MTERYLDSAPYPWPYNGNLTPENTVKLLVRQVVATVLKHFLNHVPTCGHLLDVTHVLASGLFLLLLGC